MKMPFQKISLIIASTAIIINGYAQNDTMLTNKNKRYKMGSFQLLTGFSFGRNSFLSHEEILSDVNADNQLAQIDSGYKWHSGNYLEIIGFTSSANIGLHPYNKINKAYNLNRELQIGFTLNHQYFSSLGTKETPIGSDTIAKSQIYYSETINYFNPTISYTYRTDPAKRLIWYGGYGMSFGFSYNSSLTRLTYFDTLVKQVHSGSTDFVKIHSQSIFTAYPTAINSFNIQPFILLGYNLRLAKTKRILKNMSIATEARINMNYQHFSTRKNFLKDSYLLSFGFRYNLMK